MKLRSEAWLKLSSLIDEAGDDGRYNPTSCRGRAVELIAPQLDSNQLCSELLNSLDRVDYHLWRMPYKGDSWYRSGDGYLGPRTGLGKTHIKANMLYHAAWVVDQLKDQQITKSRQHN